MSYYFDTYLENLPHAEWTIESIDRFAAWCREHAQHLAHTPDGHFVVDLPDHVTPELRAHLVSLGFKIIERPICTKN